MRCEGYRPWHTVLAIIAVAALSAQNAVGELWSDFQVGMLQWTQANHIAALTQWALPLMVMLVGSIFLVSSRPYSVRMTWQKMIPVAVISCIFWWCSAAVVCLQKYYPQEMDVVTYIHCLGLALDTPFNISYCQMLVSMFFLYPLLWKIVANEKVTRYCLMVLFVINIVLPQLNHIPYLSTVTLFTDQLNWGFYRIWAFYLMLGAYLSRRKPSWPVCLAVYCMGIVSTGLMAALTSWKTESAIGFCNNYLGMSSPFTAFQAVAIFLSVSTFCNVRMTSAIKKLEGLWMCVPMLGIISFFSARLIPTDSSHFLKYVASHMFVDTLLTITLAMVLEVIPGFRILVGNYHLEDTQK